MQDAHRQRSHTTGLLGKRQRAICAVQTRRLYLSPIYRKLMQMDAKHSSEFIAVAQRHLEVDEKKLFLIEIGLPYQENDEVWFCPYRLSGPLTKFSGRCGGVDGVQAMLNVFYVLSAEAEGSLENLERRLTWGGQRDHFGFPNHDADPELKMVRENRSKKSG